MPTFTHLMLQPRSRRSRQRRRHQRVLLTLLLGVALAGGAYLLY